MNENPPAAWQGLTPEQAARRQAQASGSSRLARKPPSAEASSLTWPW